jgi:hypothetical protein
MRNTRVCKIPACYLHWVNTVAAFSNFIYWLSLETPLNNSVKLSCSKFQESFGCSSANIWLHSEKAWSCCSTFVCSTLCLWFVFWVSFILQKQSNNDSEGIQPILGITKSAGLLAHQGLGTNIQRLFLTSDGEWVSGDECHHLNYNNHLIVFCYYIILQKTISTCKISLSSMITISHYAWLL